MKQMCHALTSVIPMSQHEGFTALQKEIGNFFRKIDSMFAYELNWRAAVPSLSKVEIQGKEMPVLFPKRKWNALSLA